MRSLLRKLFIDNWQRKVISIILAMIIWMVVYHSLTTSKTITAIPVKVINIPHGKTIEGLETTGILDRKIILTLTGTASVIDSLSSNNLEVILDAENRGDEWIATVNKENLVVLNKDLDIAKGITKISHKDFIVKLSKFVTERIPILVTKPIGEPPTGYQFLDVWPYHLYITVSGPEMQVKQLKVKGIKLTFNLNDITRAELTSLQSSKQKDEISFFVPTSWKKINIPSISTTPLEIDDPQAKALRIDFALSTLLALNTPLPVSIYFPLEYSPSINPNNTSLDPSDFLIQKNGIFMITKPLFARGVSRTFLSIVHNMIQLVVIASPKTEREFLLWNTQFIYPHELEDRYVSKIMSESTESDLQGLQKHQHEEYLRNRFRNYMNRFRLYTPNDEKLSLQIQLSNQKISVAPTSKH